MNRVCAIAPLSQRVIRSRGIAHFVGFGLWALLVRKSPVVSEGGLKLGSITLLTSHRVQRKSLKPNSGVPKSIPRQLRDFIAQYVHSVEQVEILCLFAKDPARSFSVAEVYRIIQSSEKSISDCLESFRRNELLVEESAGHYRLDTRTKDLAQGLAVTYREKRVVIIETIYGQPSDAI